VQRQELPEGDDDFKPSSPEFVIDRLRQAKTSLTAHLDGTPQAATMGRGHPEV